MDERSNQYLEANDRITEMNSLTECLDVLHRKGFYEQFRVEGKKLVSTGDGDQYRPEDVIAVNFYRFEGITDPDDMSILYAIKTVNGKKGTLIDAYGPYSDADVSAFVKQMEIHKVTM